MNKTLPLVLAGLIGTTQVGSCDSNQSVNSSDKNNFEEFYVSCEDDKTSDFGYYKVSDKNGNEIKGFESQACSLSQYERSGPYIRCARFFEGIEDDFKLHLDNNQIINFSILECDTNSVPPTSDYIQRIHDVLFYLQISHEMSFIKNSNSSCITYDLDRQSSNSIIELRNRQKDTIDVYLGEYSCI